MRSRRASAWVIALLYRRYTVIVARGWESKSIEDQINERQNEKQKSGDKTATSPKRESILLARTHTLAALESTRDERYRALLQRTLDHLDSELEKLGE